MRAIALHWLQRGHGTCACGEACSVDVQSDDARDVANAHWHVVEEAHGFVLAHVAVLLSLEGATDELATCPTCLTRALDDAERALDDETRARRALFQPRARWANA